MYSAAAWGHLQIRRNNIYKKALLEKKAVFDVQRENITTNDYVVLNDFTRSVKYHYDFFIFSNSLISFSETFMLIQFVSPSR